MTHLQAAEFLYETTLFPDRVYTFKHALTHAVAYGSLLHERRRLLHARIVEALEALSGDPLAEQVEKLAYHALRGEVWDKAHAYYRQAGAMAMARSANVELCRVWNLRQILAACTLTLGHVLALSGQASDALALLEQSEATINRSRQANYAHMLSMLSEVYWQAGRHEDAQTLATEACERARQTKERGALAWTSRLLGELHMHSDSPDVGQSETHYRQALPWPPNSACARSKPIVTMALPHCIATPDSTNRPVLHCPRLLTYTGTWR